MAVYFSDNYNQNCPASLPGDTPSVEPDLLEANELLQRTWRGLSRQIVACDRSIKCLERNLLASVQSRQILNLVFSDEFESLRGKHRILDTRISRSANLPLPSQERMLTERKMLQEEITSSTLSFKEQSEKVNKIIRQNEESLRSAKDSFRIAKDSLKVNEDLRRLPVVSEKQSKAQERFAYPCDISKLKDFLEIENANHVLDGCLDSGIRSVQKLREFSRESIKRLDIPEADISVLLSLSSKSEVPVSEEDCQHTNLLRDFPPLFSHRLKDQISISDLYNELKHAITNEDIEKFQSIFASNGAGLNIVNYQNEEGWTLLHRAALSSERQSQSEKTPSVEANRDSFMKLLLVAGADVNLKNKYGRTALHYAAMDGNISGCMALLKAGADASDVDLHGMNPLQHATLMRRGNWKEVRHLLSSRMPDCQSRTKTAKSNAGRKTKSKSLKPPKTKPGK